MPGPFLSLNISAVGSVYMIPHCALGFTSSSHPGKIPFLVAAFPFDWSICHHVGHCQLRTVPSNGHEHYCRVLCYVFVGLDTG